MNYRDFLARKSQLINENGFEPLWLPDRVGRYRVKDFQHYLIAWAIRVGRAAIFADCGLGKTLMMLIFAENVVRKTNKPFIIVTPLAVANQTVREGEKFGIECHYSRDGKHKGGIVVTNYDMLHHFDAAEFVGAAGDEISATRFSRRSWESAAKSMNLWSTGERPSAWSSRPHITGKPRATWRRSMKVSNSKIHWCNMTLEQWADWLERKVGNDGHVGFYLYSDDARRMVKQMRAAITEIEDRPRTEKTDGFYSEM